MGVSYPSDGVVNKETGVYSIEYGVSDPVHGVTKIDLSAAAVSSGDAGDSVLLFDSSGITALHLGML